MNEPPEFCTGFEDHRRHRVGAGLVQRRLELVEQERG
jgi:hypothetical protein